MTAAQTAQYLDTAISLKERELLDELYLFALNEDKGRVFFGWPERSMKVLIAQRMHSRRMVWSRDKTTGAISGMLIWMKTDEGWSPKRGEWPEDKEDGKEILVEALIATNPESRRSVVHRFISNEPDCLWMKKSARRRRGNSSFSRKVYFTNKLLSGLLK